MITVVKNGKYTGVQYSELTKEIWEHHIGYGEKLVDINKTVSEGDIPSEIELSNVISSFKTKDEQIAELTSAVSDLELLILSEGGII